MRLYKRLYRVWKTEFFPFLLRDSLVDLMFIVESIISNIFGKLGVLLFNLSNNSLALFLSLFYF